MAIPETALNNSAGFQNQVPVDSCAASWKFPSQNVLRFWHPMISSLLSDAFPLSPAHSNHPILPEWFSFAGGGNIHVAADPNQSGLLTECHSLIPTSGFRYSCNATFPTLFPLKHLP